MAQTANKEESNELVIRVHLVTALLLTALKAVIFIGIAVICFEFVNHVLGYDNVAYVFETIKMAIDSIMQSDTPLIHDILIDFIEDHAFDIVVGTILLYYLNRSSVINKYWKFTDSEFTFKEGFLSLNKKSLPLDKIMRVYAVPKFDYKNTGHLFIDLNLREKKLRLPYVFHIDEKVAEISRRVDKFKESRIEEDIERDMEQKKQLKEKIHA